MSCKNQDRLNEVRWDDIGDAINARLKECALNFVKFTTLEDILWAVFVIGWLAALIWVAFGV